MTNIEANSLVVRGVDLNEDINGLINLLDIWNAAGRPSNRRPNDWKRLPISEDLIQALYKQNTGKSRIKGNLDLKSIIYFKRGKGGGTFAHPLLALSYAEYIDPDLAIEVKNTYLRFRTGDPLLADEVLQKASDDANAWAARRAMSRVVRNEYTNTLNSHGVDKPLAIANCTNGIYRGFFGKTAKKELQSRNLPASANLRDHMNLVDLTGTLLSEALASEHIQEADLQGGSACYQASKSSAIAVRSTIDKEREERDLNKGVDQTD